MEDEKGLGPEGISAAVDTSEEEEQQLNSLGSILKAKFAEYRDSRNDVEDDWIEDLRAFMGQYDPEVIAKIQEKGDRSQVYVGLTRTKVLAAYSRMTDLLFQPGQKFFSIEETPITKQPIVEKELTEKAALEIMQAAEVIDPGLVDDLIAARFKELKEELEEETKKRVENMEEAILDQAIENNLEGKMKDAIMEQVIFGTGAMKAGTLRIDKDHKWIKTDEGFNLIYEESPSPEMEAVSIFDLYPDPYATSIDDMRNIFRRHIIARQDFVDLKEYPGFNSDLIDLCIEEYPEGNHYEEQHEKDRREIANINDYETKTYKFEVVEFWGSLNGYDLQDVGIEFDEEDDLSQEYQANIWFTGEKVIKAQLNPLPGGVIPYFIFPYEKNPHAFWGTGVPRMMRDSQNTMNAATRIYLDNVALSSGPMVEVNTDIMASGEDPTELYPWRVFLREGGDGNQPMVRFYQPQSNSPALVSVIELFRRFADETTALPSYTHGQTQSSLNRTATGISILMSNANIVLKSVIKNIDDYLTKPMVRSLYDWNMTWNDNEMVKSDMRIIARGSTALIQKEVQSQRLLQFLSLINNPMDAQMVNREKLLVDIAKSLDIDPDEVIKSQEELMNEQALQQAIAASQQGGQSPEVQNAEGMAGPDARNGVASPDGAGPVGNNGGLPL
tara:strand:- start:10242 stop:12251 length:2010 start_codon:yes stop_codon:yes gene_type:complete